MSLLASLRQRASAALGRVPAEPTVAAHSAEPRPGRLGAPAFHARGRAPIAPEPGGTWDHDPESGATLPTGPLVKVGPTEWTQARVAHRHGWFAAWAWQGANGDAAARTRALETLESWLRHDIPGHGIGWAHPSDLAARLVHWAAGVGFLGNDLPEELRAAMAGSAAWHLDHLDVRTPRREEEGLRRVIHHAGRVIGGLTFPELEGSKAAWSEGLTALGEDLPALMYADGSPRDGAPLAMAESLWIAMLARGVARANGIGFPGPGDAALSRGSRFLERLAGAIGTLPPIGDRPVDTVLPSPDFPLAASLWSLSVGFGIDTGEAGARSKDDPRLAWLGLPSGAEPAPSAGKNWAMWVWREGGVVLAEMKIKNKPSRIVATMGTTGRGSPLTHPAPLAVTWEIGDITVLGDPGPSLDHPELASWLASTGAHNCLTLDNRAPAAATPSTLDVGRVDGKKARIEGHHDGWGKAGIPVRHQRKVLLNQARCIVTDSVTALRGKTGRHAVQLIWQMGPGWELTPDGTNFTAKLGNLTLLLQLPTNLSWTVVSGRANPDPAGWLGTRPAPCLVGSGGIEGDAEFVSSFEVR